MSQVEAAALDAGLGLWLLVGSVAAVTIAAAIWRRFDFPSLIGLSVGLAGLGYLVEVEWISPLFDERTSTSLWRAGRMLLVYVVPAALWLRFHPEARRDTAAADDAPRLHHRLGLILPRAHAPLILLTGFALYSVALAAFILWPPTESGFRFWEGTTTWDDHWVVLPAICLMAMVTDLWTRGFVLLEAADRWGREPAILVQNVLWLLLHLYELDILADTMTWPGAIALALFLGITGDLVALRWRSVVGLMVGHAWLNIGWVLWLTWG